MHKHIGPDVFYNKSGIERWSKWFTINWVSISNWIYQHKFDWPFHSDGAKTHTVFSINGNSLISWYYRVGVGILPKSGSVINPKTVFMMPTMVQKSIT